MANNSLIEGIGASSARGKVFFHLIDIVVSWHNSTSIHAPAYARILGDISIRGSYLVPTTNKK